VTVRTRSPWVKPAMLTLPPGRNPATVGRSVQWPIYDRPGG
jgi:hypothetical protein